MKFVQINLPLYKVNDNKNFPIAIEESDDLPCFLQQILCYDKNKFAYKKVFEAN